MGQAAPSCLLRLHPSGFQESFAWESRVWHLFSWGFQALSSCSLFIFQLAPTVSVDGEQLVPNHSFCASLGFVNLCHVFSQLFIFCAEESHLTQSFLAQNQLQIRFSLEHPNVAARAWPSILKSRLPAGISHSSHPKSVWSQGLNEAIASSVGRRQCACLSYPSTYSYFKISSCPL